MSSARRQLVGLRGARRLVTTRRPPRPAARHDSSRASVRPDRWRAPRPRRRSIRQRGARTGAGSTRYPDESSHRKAEAGELQAVIRHLRQANERLAQLIDARKPLDIEAAFHKGEPAVSVAPVAASQARGERRARSGALRDVFLSPRAGRRLHRRQVRQRAPRPPPQAVGGRSARIDRLPRASFGSRRASRTGGAARRGADAAALRCSPPLPEGYQRRFDRARERSRIRRMPAPTSPTPR